MRSRATAGETPAALARAYGLSWTGAKKIIAGTSWTAKKSGAEMRDKDGDHGFHAVLAAAGCHRVRFHDLRHTYASHFMMSGGNILALQKLLGAEKKKLQSALKDVDASISMLGGSKKSKKKKT